MKHFSIIENQTNKVWVVLKHLNSSNTTDDRFLITCRCCAKFQCISIFTLIKNYKYFEEPSK